MRLVVISEPSAGNPFKEFAWRESNLPPLGKLSPIYEWTFHPGFLVVPGSWKITLPTDIYLATFWEDVGELDPRDLPQECAWNVHTGYADKCETIVTSLQDAKRLLEACFIDEYEDWVEWLQVIADIEQRHLLDIASVHGAQPE